MKKKIKVIFTGGTIGSTACDDNISTDDGAKYVLLDKYSEKTGQSQQRFDTIQPMSLLSENAILDDVLQMAKQIKLAQEEDVCGIILTHGSDTLAFSAPYLSLLLPDLKVPVVLVASNLVLSDENANGVDNFAGAVTLIDALATGRVPIGGGDGNNVYVSYKNPEDDFTSVHLGTRMIEPPAYSDSFYSPNGKRFAKIKDGKIHFENTDLFKSNVKFRLDTNARFEKQCLYISPYTGLDYLVFYDSDFDFALHNLYHSGTANTQDKDFKNSFLNFAKYCKANDKPLYLCNIKRKEVNYESTNLMKKYGVNFIYDTLPNVALAKVNIAYNFLKGEDIDKYMSSNICGEILQITNKNNEQTK